MPTMLSEVYDAFIEAGASEEKARKAAEAVAAYDQRFAGLETRLITLDGKVETLRVTLEGKIETLRVTLEGKIETLRTEVKGEMAWVRWMLGTNLVLTLGVLWKLLKP